ncbi:MAG: hypothetical protein VX727_07735 [Planctomycetota bacterium]|nr:hypothetical protein [Planctomycetota bacterium]
MPHPHHDSNPIRCRAALLLTVVLCAAGGCQQVRVAGRAPTAPALLPVSSQLVPVRLGIGEPAAPASDTRPRRMADGSGR